MRITLVSCTRIVSNRSANHNGDIWAHSTQPSRQNNIASTPLESRSNRNLRKCLDLGEIDVLHPRGLLFFDFWERLLKFRCDYDMPKNIQSTLLQGVAELDEFPRASGVVDEEKNLQ